MDVEVARVLALGLAGRTGRSRRAAEESHFDVVREGMDLQRFCGELLIVRVSPGTQAHRPVTSGYFVSRGV